MSTEDMSHFITTNRSHFAASSNIPPSFTLGRCNWLSYHVLFSVSGSGLVSYLITLKMIVTCMLVFYEVTNFFSHSVVVVVSSSIEIMYSDCSISLSLDVEPSFSYNYFLINALHVAHTKFISVGRRKKYIIPLSTIDVNDTQ